MVDNLFCRHHVHCVFCGRRESVRKSITKGWLIGFAGHPFAFHSGYYPSVFGPTCPLCRQIHTEVQVHPGMAIDFTLIPGHAAYLISARN